MGYIRLIIWVSTSYFTSSISIFTSRRREIQTTSEMTPYFTMTKCNKLFITNLTLSTERLPTLPSSISIISMTVVMTTLYLLRIMIKNSQAPEISTAMPVTCKRNATVEY